MTEWAASLRDDADHIGDPTLHSRAETLADIAGRMVDLRPRMNADMARPDFDTRTPDWWDALNRDARLPPTIAEAASVIHPAVAAGWCIPLSARTFHFWSLLD